MSHTEPISQTLTTEQAAAYLGVSPEFLKHDRAGYRLGRDPGPPWIKLGRMVRYLRTDLDAWLLARRRHSG